MQDSGGTTWKYSPTHTHTHTRSRVVWIWKVDPSLGCWPHHHGTTAAAYHGAYDKLFHPCCGGSEFSYELENDDFRRTKQSGSRWQRLWLNWNDDDDFGEQQRLLHFTAFMKLKLKLQTSRRVSKKDFSQVDFLCYFFPFTLFFFVWYVRWLPKMLSLGSFALRTKKAPQGSCHFCRGIYPFLFFFWLALNLRQVHCRYINRTVNSELRTGNCEKAKTEATKSGSMK